MANTGAAPVALGLWIILSRSAAMNESGSDMRVETVDVPFTDGINVSFHTIESGPHISGTATALLTFFFSLTLLCPCFIFGFMLFLHKDRILGFVKNTHYHELGDEDVWGDGAKRRARLVWEGVVALSLPWVALALGALWLGLAHSRPPAWLLLLIAAPAMARAAWLDRRAAASLGQPPRLWPLLTSKAELLDAAGDGLAVVSAAALPAHVEASFVASLVQLPLLRGLLHGIGLAGALAAALAFATVVQASVLVHAGAAERPEDNAVAADLAGFGALALGLEGEAQAHAQHLVRGMNAVVLRPFYMGLARAVAEAAPQMLLQSSLLMAAGESLLSQPTVLISVLLSMATLGQKTLGLLTASTPLHGLLPPLLLGVALLTGVILLTGTKLVMIELCPDRLWGLSTGCMERPPQ